MCVECLLCAICCSRHCGFGSEPQTKIPALMELTFGKETINSLHSIHKVIRATAREQDWDLHLLAVLSL